MTSRIGVLSPESRSKRIHIAECQRKRLNMQLSGHRQRSVLAKEILVVFRVIARGHRKGLSGTFRIIACDDRRMHIDEALILEKLMDRH